MTRSLSPRLGLHRWSDDADPWERADFDADNAALEALVATATQGLYADRPAAGKGQRFYLATDAGPFGTMFYDNGTAWREVSIGQGWTNYPLTDPGVVTGMTLNAGGACRYRVTGNTVQVAYVIVGLVTGTLTLRLPVDAKNIAVAGWGIPVGRGYTWRANAPTRQQADPSLVSATQAHFVASDFNDIYTGTYGSWTAGDSFRGMFSYEAA